MGGVLIISGQKRQVIGMLSIYSMVVTQTHIKIYQALVEIFAFYVVYCMYARHQIKNVSSGFLFHHRMETLPTLMRK